MQQDPVALRNHINAFFRVFDGQRPVSSAAVTRTLLAKHGLEILEGATLYGVAQSGDVIAPCLEGERKNVTAQPARVVPAPPAPRAPVN